MAVQKPLLFATALRLSLMEEDEEEIQSELSEEWQDTDKVSGPNIPFSHYRGLFESPLSITE